ncbi:ankyrin repeat-containing domain protein [Whalleya microplaca]|nr:ankyrin repeat-containing domain protein [Whalleya microplaca]
MDNDGRTALSRASGNGHSDVVKTLLEKSINSIDLADNGGRTALLRAAGNGHSNIVRILREKGASTC